MRPARRGAGSLFPFTLLAFLIFAITLDDCSRAEKPRESNRDSIWLGRWEGESPEGRGIVRLEISHPPASKGADEPEGRLSLPEQALYDISLQELKIGKSRIRFELELAGQCLDFRGRLRDPTGTGRHVIAGDFSSDRRRGQRDAATQLAGEIGFEKIPSKVVSYRVEEVSFPGASGLLSGTLTLPAGPGPFPAAVLISPEGPHNRDTEIGGIPLFALIADLLTRQGIAVLRCDDRGVGRSEGRFETAGLADFADDARAGAAYLRERQGILSAGFIGQGEGGLAAIHAAVRETESPPSFLVLLSTPFDDFPLLAEIRELTCPLLSVWGANEPSGEPHDTRLLGILEESEHPDYTAVRISEGSDYFLMEQTAFVPRFEGLLTRWLSCRVGGG